MTKVERIEGEITVTRGCGLAYSDRRGDRAVSDGRAQTEITLIVSSIFLFCCLFVCEPVYCCVCLVLQTSNTAGLQ